MFSSTRFAHEKKALLASSPTFPHLLSFTVSPPLIHHISLSLSLFQSRTPPLFSAHPCRIGRRSADDPLELGMLSGRPSARRRRRRTRRRGTRFHRIGGRANHASEPPRPAPSSPSRSSGALSLHSSAASTDPRGCAAPYPAQVPEGRVVVAAVSGCTGRSPSPALSTSSRTCSMGYPPLHSASRAYGRSRRRPDLPGSSTAPPCPWSSPATVSLMRGRKDISKELYDIFYQGYADRDLIAKLKKIPLLDHIQLLALLLTRKHRPVALIGQSKKSNLKKCREELQLRVAGWFKGRAGRARSRGCRGRLLGGWAPAISQTDATPRRQGPGRSVASPVGCRLPTLAISRTDTVLRGQGCGRIPCCERQQSEMAMAIVRRSGAVPQGERAGRRRRAGEPISFTFLVSDQNCVIVGDAGWWSMVSQLKLLSPHHKAIRLMTTIRFRFVVLIL